MSWLTPFRGEVDGGRVVREKYSLESKSQGMPSFAGGRCVIPWFLSFWLGRDDTTVSRLEAVNAAPVLRTMV